MTAILDITAKDLRPGDSLGEGKTIKQVVTDVNYVAYSLVENPVAIYLHSPDRPFRVLRAGFREQPGIRRSDCA